MPSRALFTRPFSAAALTAALALGLPPLALAEADKQLTGETFWVGDDTASNITGNNNDAAETIFGDPVSKVGEPVGLSSKLLSVGRNADGTPLAANNHSGYIVAIPQAFSPDGTRMLFNTNASNLPTAGSGAGLREVNLETGEITSPPGFGGSISSFARSPDGKWIAVSREDPNGFGQIEVIDVATGTAVTVSRSRGDGAPGNDSSIRPVYSPDGRYLMFESRASNLVMGDGNNASDIFLVDLTDLPNAHKSMVIASAQNGGLGADGPSYGGSFMPDGNAIVLTSEASNIAFTFGAEDTTPDRDVFLKTLDWDATGTGSFMKGAVRVVSSNAMGKGKVDGLDACAAYEPVVSPDGTRVAFTSDCEELDPTDDSLPVQTDIFVKWIAAAGGHPNNDIVLVSKSAAGAQGGGQSKTPVFSPDGKLLAFQTGATLELTGIGGATKVQIVVKDLSGSGVVSLVSGVGVPDGAGTPVFTVADDNSDSAVFTPDGRGIVYRSRATNLSTQDSDAVVNGSPIIDIFLATLPAATGAADKIRGLGGNDRLFGAAGNDYIKGYAGSDLIVGGEGDDYALYGDEDDDVIFGGEGNDGLYGDAGNDRLAGGPGLDFLVGGSGNDIETGGAGDDMFDGSLDPGDDVLDGGEGMDRLFLFGPRPRYLIKPVADGFTVTDIATGLPADQITGTDTVRGIETLFLVSPANGSALGSYPLDASITATNNRAPVALAAAVRVKPGVAKAFVPARDLDGDVALYAIAAQPKAGKVTLSADKKKVTYTAAKTTKAFADSFKVSATDPWGAKSTVTVKIAIGRTLTGNARANRLTGGAGDDTINGLGGRDRLAGGAGDDRLSGGKGADKLSGGAGNDRLDGGAGIDAMAGGAGNDTYVVDNARDKVTEAKNAGTDTVRTRLSYRLPANVENLVLLGTKAVNGTGNGLANALTGNAKANRLAGGAGNDVLAGGAGADRLDGGTGLDTASYASASAKVFVDLKTGFTDGAAKGDVLTSIENVTGSRFDDTLFGGDGPNVIVGGGGKDKLAGGKDRDRFVYTAASDSTPAREDLITDFQGTDQSGGGDILDLAAIDADTTKPGNQDFAYVTGSDFSGAAGEMLILAGPGVSFRFSGDTNGDKTADFSVLVELTGSFDGAQVLGVVFP